MQSYTTGEVAAAAGATYRQVDTWCRRGLISPSIAAATGQGSQRRWSAADVEAVRRVAAIAQARRRTLAELVA